MDSIFQLLQVVFLCLFLDDSHNGSTPAKWECARFYFRYYQITLSLYYRKKGAWSNAATSTAASALRMRLGTGRRMPGWRRDPRSSRPRHMVFCRGRRGTLQSGGRGQTQAQVDPGDVARRYRFCPAQGTRRQTGRSAFTPGRQRSVAPGHHWHVRRRMGRGNVSQLCRTEREFDVCRPTSS